MRTLVLFALAGSLSACTSTSPMTLPAQCEHRNIAPNDTRTYHVSVRAGDLLDVTVDQDGIDLVVELRDAAGKTILTVDSPNGTHGPEKLMWVAADSSTVLLLIRAFDKTSAAGRYQLCATTRVATEDDKQVAEEIVLLAEASRYRAIGLNYEPGAAADYLRARDAAERGLAIRERRLGRNDLRIAAFLDILGYIEDEAGDYAKGTQYFERALALRRAAGDSSRDLLRTESDLAWLLLGHGDATRAAEHFRNVVSADPNRSGAKQGLAAALLDLGQLDEAESMTQTQLNADIARLGPDHRSLAPYFNRLGDIALARGDRAAARENFNRALAITRRAMDRAIPLTGLAQIALEEGDAKTALAHVVEARSLRAAAFGPEHPNQVSSMTIHAEALAALGDRDAARSLLADAQRLAARFLLPSHPCMKRLERALAEISAGPRENLSALHYE